MSELVTRIKEALGEWPLDDALRVAWSQRGAAAWRASEAPEDMLALVAHADPRQAVRTACACARAVLSYVPAEEGRPAAALETAEAWCRSDVPDDELRRVIDDAAAAASEAEAAADAEDELGPLTAAADAAEAAAAAVKAAADAKGALAARERQAWQALSGELFWCVQHLASCVSAVRRVLVTAANPPEGAWEAAFVASASRVADMIRERCPCPTLEQFAAMHPPEEDADPTGALVWYCENQRPLAQWMADFSPEGALEPAWRAGRNAQWLLKLLAFAGDRQALVRGACVCARSLLRFADDERPARAIEVAERWADGAATLEEVRAARDAIDPEGAADVLARAAGKVAEQAVSLALDDEALAAADAPAWNAAVMLAHHACGDESEYPDDDRQRATDAALAELAAAVRAAVACPSLAQLQRRPSSG
jgi:hypothetical protein